MSDNVEEVQESTPEQSQAEPQPQPQEQPQEPQNLSERPNDVTEVETTEQELILGKFKSQED